MKKNNYQNFKNIPKNAEFWSSLIYKGKNILQNAEFWSSQIFYYKFIKGNQSRRSGGKSEMTSKFV